MPPASSKSSHTPSRPGASRRNTRPARLGVRVLAMVVAVLAPAMAAAAAPDAAALAAQAEIRSQEIAACLPGEQGTWRDGRDRAAIANPLRLVYRHAGAPTWLSAAQVLQLIERAAFAWSACGIGAQIDRAPEQGPPPPGSVLLQWDEAGSRGGVGLANLGQRTLALNPALFQLLATRNPRHPAADTLQMVLSHELGHFYGLMAHSSRCVDVMSYYGNAQGERCSTRSGRAPLGPGDYRALLPTACDIARCRQLNPPPAR